MKDSKAILSVRDLRVHFPKKTNFLGQVTSCLKAVDGISFDLKQGETLGIVGESGCGKSTTARAILNLIPLTSGEIIFNQKRLTTMSHQEIRNSRKDMQIVFQDPYSSLNPRMTLGRIICEPLINFSLISRKEIPAKSTELLKLVGLPSDFSGRYPHELSGGQRQRIGIARALSLNPKLLFLDEPVSALDVSVQSQIVNLLKKLQKELGLTYVFISHDLSVVRHISDRVAVMRSGKFVEFGDSQEVISKPKHPYTKNLLDSVPTI